VKPARRKPTLLRDQAQSGRDRSIQDFEFPAGYVLPTDITIANTTFPETSSWPPQVFGFKGRPEADQISSLICHLPACFRTGLGWLIGGSGQSARSFERNFPLMNEARQVPNGAVGAVGRSCS